MGMPDVWAVYYYLNDKITFNKLSRGESCVAFSSCPFTIFISIWSSVLSTSASDQTCEEKRSRDRNRQSVCVYAGTGKEGNERKVGQFIINSILVYGK